MPERYPLLLCGNARRVAELNPPVNAFLEPKEISASFECNTANLNCFRS